MPVKRKRSSSIQWGRISWDSDSYYEGPLEALARQASELQRAGRLKEAEEVFRRLHEACPERPNALNNLAKTLERQGRAREAREILEQIWRDYPDYFFGQTSKARCHISEGRLEEAEAILEALLRRPRLHVSEFGALCDGFLTLRGLQGQGWMQWVDIWRRFEEAEPLAVRYRSASYDILTASFSQAASEEGWSGTVR